MKCPSCSEVSTIFYEAATLVGYAPNRDGHFHDDNCLKRYYICLKCRTEWIESKIRTCDTKGCNWKGKLSCDCHPDMKVNEWSDLGVKPSLDHALGRL